MKRSTVLAACYLTSLMVTCLVGTLAYGGAKPPSNEPPFGLAISSDAQGTKLNGVISVELKSQTCPPVNGVYPSMSVQIRLQKGSLVQLFFDPNFQGSFNPSVKANIQAAVISHFKTDILNAFGLTCGSQTCPVLKNADLEVDSQTQGTSCPSLFYMADIILSVQ